MAKKAKTSLPNVPQSIQDVEQLEREITNEILEIQSLGTNEEAEIAAIHAKYALKIGPKVEMVQAKAAQVHAYAEAHKEALTESGTKNTVALGSAGKFQWTTLPASVVITNAKRVIDEIVKRRLRKKFLREKYEINKEALLENEKKARTVPGITFVRPRKCYLRPADTDARVEMDEREGMWQIVWPKKKKENESD